eukprot:scaffold1.g5347.t1
MALAAAGGCQHGDAQYQAARPLEGYIGEHPGRCDAGAFDFWAAGATVGPLANADASAAAWASTKAWAAGLDLAVNQQSDRGARLVATAMFALEYWLSVALGWALLLGVPLLLLVWNRQAVKLKLEKKLAVRVERDPGTCPCSTTIHDDVSTWKPGGPIKPVVPVLARASPSPAATQPQQASPGPVQQQKQAQTTPAKPLAAAASGSPVAVRGLDGKPIKHNAVGWACLLSSPGLQLTAQFVRSKRPAKLSVQQLVLTAASRVSCSVGSGGLVATLNNARVRKGATVTSAQGASAALDAVSLPAVPAAAAQLTGLLGRTVASAGGAIVNKKSS